MLVQRHCLYVVPVVGALAQVVLVCIDVVCDSVLRHVDIVYYHDSDQV